MRQLLKQWGLLVLVTGAVLALDQAVKWRVARDLALGQSWDPIPAISGFLRITRSYNTGAAFGLLPNASDSFLALALVTIVIFLVSYPRLPSHAWLSRLSIALISGGALSNALDRIRLGRVIDYVHVQLTPTFSNISNFADHAIVVGATILLVDQWLAERREARQKALEEDKTESSDTSPESGQESDEGLSEAIRQQPTTDVIPASPDEPPEV